MNCLFFDSRMIPIMRPMIHSGTVEGFECVFFGEDRLSIVGSKLCSSYMFCVFIHIFPRLFSMDCYVKVLLGRTSRTRRYM